MRISWVLLSSFSPSQASHSRTPYRHYLQRHSILSLPSLSPLPGPGGVPFDSFVAVLHYPCACASKHTHTRVGCHWLLRVIAMQSSVHVGCHVMPPSDAQDSNKVTPTLGISTLDLRYSTVMRLH